jgi:hypothetical protein
MAYYSIYIFHILFVGPLLVLIGLYHDSPKFPNFIWELLMIMGIGIIGYHSYKAYKMYKLVNSS